MFVVLIAARYARILEWIQHTPCQDIHEIDVVKQVGPKLFLYVDTSLDFLKLVECFQKQICRSGGLSYVYQFYSLFQGKIDYNAYLPEETKKAMSYYQAVPKDLSDDEIKTYLALKK